VQLLHEFKDLWRDNPEYPLVVTVAYDMNVCGYGLACYQNFLNETKESLNAAFMSLEHALNHFEGSFRVAIAYAVRITEKYPDDIKGYYSIFSANMDPCCDLPIDEELEIAQKMARKWPNNEDVIRDVKWRTEYCEKNNIIPRLFVEKLTEKIIENKREAFKWLIPEGRFAESRLLLADFFEEEVEQILREIATESQSVCAYDYVWFWMRERCGESSKRHLFLAYLTKMIFQYQKNGELKSYAGTKELHFFHIYRSTELSPDDIDIQEKLLSLYEVGNESFDVEETLQLAQCVLSLKPESIEAQRVLDLMH
jgi:hypothetical protein